MDESEAIKLGESILQGGPTYNPFIKIKYEKQNKHCCNCNCHEHIEENTTKQIEKYPDLDLNFLDSVDSSFDQLLNKPPSQADIIPGGNDILLSPSILDLSLEGVTLSEDLAIKTFTTTEELTTENRAESSPTTTTVPKTQKSTKKQSKNIPVPPIHMKVEDHNYCRVSDDEPDDDDDDDSDEEYVPVPTKKRRTNTKAVSAYGRDKDQKYIEKRMKNNLAAKRSREAKRQREIEAMQKTLTLEKENSDLNKEVNKLKKMIARLENKLR
ncbi:transcription factor VBP isoform X2 [Nematostella vectensis]|nr:transcription factor VBP isoform X2 [Nematostella vectensis]XP_048589388.1 transcription factor VBP isoform X2 [Nematostella vectensis]